MKKSDTCRVKSYGGYVDSFFQDGKKGNPHRSSKSLYYNQKGHMSNPCTSKKQFKAMAAEYGRRKAGKGPQMFKKMSMADLKEWIDKTPDKYRS